MEREGGPALPRRSATELREEEEVGVGGPRGVEVEETAAQRWLFGVVAEEGEGDEAYCCVWG